jgi:aspartyl-tRNA(Asn)/glutamyl-tRNA(Gln) amidotransferase subunit C
MTPRVSVDDVRHVAALARLGLSEEQLTGLATELNTILEHMDVLNRVDTSGVSELGSLSERMRLRSDERPQMPLADPPESFAPQMRDGFFIVPRLATHEDTE